jgi:3-oxoacyl-[acyl-carrier protein] reductase
MRLHNKVALITGGGRGIGKAIAIGFAQQGAKIAVAARTIDEIESTAEEVRATGIQSFPFRADVTDEAQVKELIKATLGKFGRIDILVNNAGLGAFRPVYGIHMSNWENIIAINLTSTFLCTKHVWKPMRKQGGGSIVNVSSTSGTKAYPLYTSYSAAKWGQIGFTKSTAEEGKAFNIRVNAIAPGKVDTSMRASVAEDKNKILKAEDCVGPVIFLASDEARFVTVQVIEIEWFGPEETG